MLSRASAKAARVFSGANRDAPRCASTSGGPLAVTVTSAVPPAGGQIVTIANQAALESSKDGTPAGSAIAGATLTVTFSNKESTGARNSAKNIMALT